MKTKNKIILYNPVNPVKKYISPRSQTEELSRYQLFSSEPAWTQCIGRGTKTGDEWNGCW